MKIRYNDQLETVYGWYRLAPTKRCSKISYATTMLTLVIALGSLSAAVQAQCHRTGSYDAQEIASSTFFSAREQTKFAPEERHYPLASGSTARYCFSRGCTGQLSVAWTEQELAHLRQLRASLVDKDGAAAELRFIKIATLQMETWLYKRLRNLDPGVVGQIMKRGSGNYSVAHSQSDHMNWMTTAMASYDRFDKECATYAMEATQHLLVLANAGLIRHWNVKAPVYRYGVPGHWTAGLENRDTCQNYRFDLNSRASARYDLHKRGQNPAALALQNPRQYGALFPGMDGNGVGRPSGRRAAAAPL